MYHSNTYELILTGTNFGLLSNYPRAVYLDGYFFNDLFGNTNINYTYTISGNIFLSGASAQSISALPGLVTWLDASDSNKTLTSVYGVTGLIDKSPQQRLYLANEPIQSCIWPISGGYNNNLSAVNIIGTNYFYNSSFCISLSSPFTLLVVWLEKNSVLGENYPFSFLTEYNNVTGDLVFINNYDNNTATWGYRESTYGILLTGIPFRDLKENYFIWTHYGNGPLAVSSQKLDIFNTTFSGATDFYYISGDPAAPATTIGSYSGINTNNFIFGEMMLFNRVVSGIELIDIKNFINKKWNFNLYEENVFFNAELSGGPFSNITYEDFSLLTSEITIPIQSCVTLLTINLSSFDQSVSKISKVLCNYNNTITELSPSIDITSGQITSILKDNIINILLNPAKDKFLSTYSIKLSVLRFDSTVNKLHLSGNILKCGIKDYFSNSKLIDSQVVDDSNNVLILTEDTEKKLMFINKINVNIPTQTLTGGDVEPLVNTELVSPESDIVLLADLLEGETVKETYKIPIIPPLPRPRINPILPT